MDVFNRSPEVMTLRQAAHYLGVTTDTLYKYIGELKLPAFKLGGRWRFKKSKLDEWMEEQSSRSRKTASPPPRKETETQLGRKLSLSEKQDEMRNRQMAARRNLP